MKTDAKFYVIHVSPSEKELKALGNTEQEQWEAMKRYIREVVIPEYAKNFKKGLSAEDIKFYGKIHFDRGRSNNELNMHCHLIVSRKDQTNKKKLSPLTNHRNTKKGVIKGGFDRTKLFQQAEQGFDRLFSYNRELTESFEYYNTVKNGKIEAQIEMQEKVDTSINAYKQTGRDANLSTSSLVDLNQSNSESTIQPTKMPNLGLSSALGLLTPELNNTEEQQIPVKRKKKKPKRGFRR